jgi:Fe-S-cluster containining protein
MTELEIEADAVLQERVQKNPKLKKELLAGHPGESHWHRLPAGLKSQWQAYVDRYQLPSYDGTVGSLDGPCIWLDMDTRQCTNHEYRPNICRDFKTGSQRCLDWRKHYDQQITKPI